MPEDGSDHAFAAVLSYSQEFSEHPYLRFHGENPNFKLIGGNFQVNWEY
jgi:hypothetical protein